MIANDVSIFTVGTCYQYCALMVALFGYLVRGAAAAGLAREDELVFRWSPIFFNRRWLGARFGVGFLGIEGNLSSRDD